MLLEIVGPRSVGAGRPAVSFLPAVSRIAFALALALPLAPFPRRELPSELDLQDASVELLAVEVPLRVGCRPFVGEREESPSHSDAKVGLGDRPVVTKEVAKIRLRVVVRQGPHPQLVRDDLALFATRRGGSG